MRLPKPPLIEVVFEIRWEIEQSNHGAGYIGRDVGYPIFEKSMDAFASGMGLKTIVPMHPPGFPEIPYSVRRRYQKASDVAFPLLQIGPGLMCCNDSFNYDWPQFRKFIAQSLDALFKAYPRLPDVNLNPCRLELRYHDAFNEADIGHLDTLKFVNEKTTFSVGLSKYFASTPFNKETNLDIRIEKKVQSMPDTVMGMAIQQSSVNRRTPGATDVKAILAANVVYKEVKNAVPGSSAPKKIAYINQWLEDAHTLTHDYFISLLTPEFAQTFTRETKKAKVAAAPTKSAKGANRSAKPLPKAKQKSKRK